MKRSIIYIISFLITINNIMADVLRISNQKEFDMMVDRINSGHPENVYLSPGTYLLKQSIVAKAPLFIAGNNAVIESGYVSYEEKEAVSTTEDYYIYRQKNTLSHFPLIVDEQNNPIDISESVEFYSKVNTINTPIIGEYAAKEGVEIKIPIAKNLSHLSGKKFSKAFGYFDCGWSRVNFCINRSDNNFFYCKTLNYTNVKNYNYDLDTYKRGIRYVIYNAEQDGKGIFFDDKFIYIPKNHKKVFFFSDFLSERTKPTILILSNVLLEGITLNNISGICIKSKSQSTCLIKKCTFCTTLTNALKIWKDNSTDVSPAVIDQCSFINCALLSDNSISLLSPQNNRSCITFRNSYISKSSNAKVLFKNTSNTIEVDGDVKITNNTFVNSCRGHLYLNQGNIVCTNNLLFNTKEFLALEQRNRSSDFGLIYCNNPFYSTPIKISNNKRNIIHLEQNILFAAYAYGGDARGIFIDDGRCDVTCKHNIILDTQMYSIDSREATNFKGYSSVRNKIIENIIQKRYRLEASDSVSTNAKPITSGNCVISSTQKNVLKNHSKVKDDYTIPIYNPVVSIQNRKVLLNESEYNKLKKLPYWSSIKKKIAKK